MASDIRIVKTPAGYVPTAAMWFGAEGEAAAAVSPERPLPVADACYANAAPLVPGEPAAPGRALMAVCTTPGNVTLQLAGGGAVTVPLGDGLSILPFAVTQVVPAAGAATATYRNLF